MKSENPVRADDAPLPEEHTEQDGFHMTWIPRTSKERYLTGLHALNLSDPNHPYGGDWHRSGWEVPCTGVQERAHLRATIMSGARSRNHRPVRRKRTTRLPPKPGRDRTPGGDARRTGVGGEPRTRRDRGGVADNGAVDQRRKTLLGTASRRSTNGLTMAGRTRAVARAASVGQNGGGITRAIAPGRSRVARVEDPPNSVRRLPVSRANVYVASARIGRSRERGAFSVATRERRNASTQPPMTFGGPLMRGAQPRTVEANLHAQGLTSWLSEALLWPFAVAQGARGIPHTQRTGPYISELWALNIHDGEPGGDWHGAAWFRREKLWRDDITLYEGRTLATLGGTDIYDARRALRAHRHPQGWRMEPVWAAGHARACVDIAGRYIEVWQTARERRTTGRSTRQPTI